MNKEIKKLIIRCSSIIIFGLIIFALIITFKDMFTENQMEYVTSFCATLVAIGIILIIKTIFAISGADKGNELANSLKDERLILLNNEASAITFKITILIVAISSVVLMFFNYEKEAMITSIIVGISTLIYLITYFLLSKNK